MPATYVRDAELPSRADGGQSLVEFALGLLVMMLLIFGIVDLSRVVFARNAMTSAAREGARAAIVHPKGDPALLQPTVEAAAKATLAGLDLDAVHVQLTYATDEDGDEMVQVEVTYTFHAITPLIGQIIDGGSGAGIPLRGRSQMMIASKKEL